MSNGSLRVVIADDHSVVRQGIRGVLEQIEDLEVIGEAGDGAEALAMVSELSPDVVVLDVNMPEKSGLEVTMELREEAHPARVLILSMHDDPEYVLQAVRSGADGYVLKDVSPAELRDAVAAVHEGRDYFTARVTQQLSVALRKEIEEEQLRTRLDSLTNREREVLLLVAQGLTNREIGEQLEISPRTVETHRERVMGKLRIRTVAGLTRFVVEHGLDEV
ncbi:MAG: response regulator transcription factor [Gemmatimonadota bacterium]|nr:response regulator transcription factor [Gemmatimonadota bacterium]MDE3005287.1 response regulator transcription factor [Gemmatimonadota bacterium]MDE3014669.1 response regulator transcription factor [Gemmatimonadota bacterium]